MDLSSWTPNQVYKQYKILCNDPRRDPYEFALFKQQAFKQKKLMHRKSDGEIVAYRKPYKARKKSPPLGANYISAITEIARSKGLPV